MCVCVCVCVCVCACACVLPTCRHSKMPPGVSDRSLIQYIKHIDDTKNKAHIILYKNFPGDHPNAPDMSGTVRWVRGGVTREYISVTDMHSHVVYAHVHTHTCMHAHAHTLHS